MGLSTLSLISVLLLVGVPSSPRSIVPSFPDLTIKTRHIDGRNTHTETLYLKGARQRIEAASDGPLASPSTNILQCDQRLRILLNKQAKVYAELPIRDSQPSSKNARPIAESQMTGKDVTIIFDSVDTGERRSIGGYLARHIKSTVTTDAPSGAAIPASLLEQDGWYIDFPGLYCRENAQAVSEFLVANVGNRYDRVHFKRMGTASKGFPIEETTCTTQNGISTESKIELLEISQVSLNPSLFERPKDYAQAKRMVNGGFDMTKPDTLSNRVYVFLQDLKSSLGNWKL